MNKIERRELMALIESRMDQLQTELQSSHSTADKLQQQADDASANLDLTTNASVDEKIFRSIGLSCCS